MDVAKEMPEREGDGKTKRREKEEGKR